MFENISEVQERLADQKYVCDRKLATVVYLATKLEKPVLVEGPAGVGKPSSRRLSLRQWAASS